MNIPNDPKAKKAILNALEEISKSMGLIEGERIVIKETVKEICEEYDISKKTFRKLAKTFHKQNFSIEVAENEEFQQMYEQLTNQTSLGVVANG